MHNYGVVVFQVSSHKLFFPMLLQRPACSSEAQRTYISVTGRHVIDASVNVSTYGTHVTKFLFYSADSSTYYAE